MKVIITGGTGLAGSAVVRYCIANPAITEALVLTRRPLPEEIAKSEKVKTILHDDFSKYPEELLEKLVGASGVIWCLGGKVSQFGGDIALATKVQAEFPHAAAEAFIKFLAPKVPDGKKFRFVFCSGKMAEWDQTRWLVIMPDTRRIKGIAEKGLCELADANKDVFELFIGRPSGILPPGAGIMHVALGKLFAGIGADHLAAVLVKMFLEGYEDRILEGEKMLSM